MLLLVSGVQLGIVGLAIGEHFEKDFKQTLSQAAERTSMAHSSLALFFIIGLSPNAGPAKAVGPQVKGVSQEGVAGPAHPRLADLARLKADRRGSRQTLALP